MSDASPPSPSAERLARMIAAASADMTRFIEERETILDERSEIQLSAAQFADAWSTYRADQLPGVIESIRAVTDEALQTVGLTGYELALKETVIRQARTMAANEWANARSEGQEPNQRPFAGTPDRARPRGRIKRNLLKLLKYLLEQIDNAGDSAAGLIPVLEPFLELKKVLESLIGVSGDLAEP